MYFFFNDTATTEIYTLSLHDALPISILVVATILQVTGIWNDFIFGLTFAGRENLPMTVQLNNIVNSTQGERAYNVRSEEHTSELQSRQYLVCRLLLEKKKKPCHCRPH